MARASKNFWGILLGAPLLDGRWRVARTGLETRRSLFIPLVRRPRSIGSIHALTGRHALSVCSGWAEKQCTKLSIHLITPDSVRQNVAGIFSEYSTGSFRGQWLEYRDGISKLACQVNGDEFRTTSGTPKKNEPESAEHGAEKRAFHISQQYTAVVIIEPPRYSKLLQKSYGPGLCSVGISSCEWVAFSEGREGHLCTEDDLSGACVGADGLSANVAKKADADPHKSCSRLRERTR